MNVSHGKAILVIASVVALSAVVAGVVVVGSPGEARLLQSDSERVHDLRGIMTAADSFWSRNGRLPASLSELAGEPRTRISTLDPVSGESYEYQTTAADSFELCTVFDLPSPPIGRRPPSGFWVHGAGRTCFLFTQGEAR